MLLFLTLLLPIALPNSDVALRGLDPVHLCEGEERPGLAELERSAGRYTYRFATPASAERFEAAPGRFGIQWGGACGRMGPLSGRGDAERFAVHDGRIFIFASDGCRDGFLSSPGRFVEPPPPPPTPSEAARAAGLEWIALVVLAHGLPPEGEPLVQHFRASAVQSGWSNEHELVTDAAGRVMRRSYWAPPEGEDGAASETRWVVVPGESAFTLEDGTAFDLGPAERADALRFLLRQPTSLLALRGRDDFVAFPGREGEVVVHVAGLSCTLVLDEDGRIGSIAWRGRLGDGMTRDVVEVFADYREIGGLVVPFSREVRLDGEVSETKSGAWDTVERTTAVSPATFERP